MASHSNSESNNDIVGPTMFMPQKHPELHEIGIKPIQTFLQKREQYLLKADDAAAQGSTYTPVSLVNSVDFKLLKALIAFDTFRDVSDISELTDDCLLEWLEQQIDKSSTVTTPEVLEAELKKRVKLDLKEADPRMRFMNLFMKYYTFLEERNLSDLIHTNPRTAIQHICSLLRPTGFQQKIENDLALDKAHLKKDWKGFYRHVIENAISFEAFYSSMLQAANKSALSSSDTSEKSGSSHKRGYRGRQSHSKENVAKQANNAEAKADPANAAAHAKNDNNHAPNLPPFCLNEETCPEERHYMRDCKKTPDDKKRQLLAERRKKKRQNAPALKRVGLSDNAQPSEHFGSINTAKGRISATLSDCLPVVVSGDYGSDHAALSEHHLAQLAQANIFVPILPLQNPITMHLAVEGSDSPFVITSERKARISTTLSTTEGDFRLRNVEYLVFKEPMKEVLLSRPLLQSLGFNLDEHLARVRRHLPDFDCSNIGFEPNVEMAATISPPDTKLSRLLYAELPNEATFLDESDDEGPNVSKLATVEDSSDVSKRPVMDVGKHNAADIQPHIERMYKDALDNGLPVELAPRLLQLLADYKDIFRIKLGSDPPVKVPPMRIRLTPTAAPVRVKLRRYSEPQQKFLQKKVGELQQLGLVKRNTQSSWACAPLIVPKPGPDNYRFTADLRPVNKVTIPTAWPMPNLETNIPRFAKKKCFGDFDLCQGYWQFPLEEESQECQSFITPDGVYTPTRVMQGQRNAVAYCQSTVQSICEPIADKILVWLDDILASDKDAKSLLDTYEALFKLCSESNLKFHAAKCHLYKTTVRWCGRLINEHGVRMDPSNMQALLDMPSPKTADQLQQFVCAANWMRSTIPEYTTLIEPLSTLLESIYTKTGGRTKRRVSKVRLEEAGWDTAHESVFSKVKNTLANAVTLAHPDSSKILCLFTDASDRHWSGVLTQIPSSDLDKPFAEQNHEPLAFISGSFTGSSLRWSTVEKEAAAIINSVERLDYLLMRPEGFHIFTDHSNLVFIFNPETAAVRLNKGSLSKVQRWGMILAQYNYTIVHISGEDNYWADLLTRWGASSSDTTLSSHENKHMRIAALMVAPLVPDQDPDFTWPKVTEIVSSQQSVTAAEKEEFRLTKNDEILMTPSGKIYVPFKDTHLQLRICVIGHCGRGGHRALNSTLSAINDYCIWKTMQQDISAFCASCFHCVSTIGGKRVPRPLGHALHAEKPNEIIHFDFLFMGASQTDEEYALIIKDDLSSYTWLLPAKETDGKTAADCLLKWFAAFGVVQTWVSDRGSHFKNNLMDLINRGLHCHHHFTTPNTPQANGTVERVCREVLRCCRALLSEFRMKENEWPYVLPIIQSVLNHSKLSSLGDRAPITAFAGLPPDNPLRLLIPPAQAKPTTLNHIRIAQKLNIEAVQNSIKNIHREVAERKTKHRDAAIQRHNAKTNVRQAHFTVGDYVLVARRIDHDGHKLKMRWLGPQKVIRVVSDWVFECQDLLNESVSLVHANRLKYYADSQLNVTQELLDTIDHNDIHYSVASKLLDLRYNRSKKYYEVQVKWKGFDHEEPTWESIHILHEDIPDMLKAFLSNHQEQGKAKRAQESVSRT